MNSNEAHKIVFDWINKDLVSTAAPKFIELASLVKRMVEATAVAPSCDPDPVGFAISVGASPKKRSRTTRATAKPEPAAVCKVAGCGRDVRSKGFCNRCYQRKLKGLPMSINGHAEDTVPKTRHKSGLPTFSPTELDAKLTADELAKHRCPDCPSYNKCLDWAHKRKWLSFSCKKCSGPALVKP